MDAVFTGDALLMDSRLWHRGGANKSRSRRSLLEPDQKKGWRSTSAAAHRLAGSGSRTWRSQSRMARSG